MTRRPPWSAMAIASSYVALSLLVLAAFATFLWFAWGATIEAGRTRELHADAAHLRALAQQRGVAALLASINLQVASQRHGHDYYLLLADAALRPLAGNLPAWPLEAGAAAGRATRWLPVQGRQVRMALVTTDLPGGLHLLVGNDVGQYRTLEFTFFTGLCLVVFIVLLLGLGGGMLLRRGLVAQIARLTGGVREVSDAIAHDLRTPLTIVRARLERALASQTELPAARVAMEEAIADIDHVTGIFNALLRLAEIDTGNLRAGFVAVNLPDIAGEVAELYRDLAESRGQSFQFSADRHISVSGDPVLLAQAIANLLDNAVKYNRNGGHITLSLNCHQRDGVTIAISDQGGGIPDEEKLRVQERFYRRDSSRNTPGVGLGLSLVAAVAALHHGRFCFKDGRPGLIALLQFPAKPAF